MALRLLALLAALQLIGCSAPTLTSRDEASLVADPAFIVIEGLDVPAVQGPAGCGAQALATILAARDGSDAATLARELPWHDLGATPVELLLEARRRGFDARVARGDVDDVRDAVERGDPVLVMIDNGLEVRTLLIDFPTPRVMHWAVVSGIDAEGSRILLAAPDARHHVVDVDDFEARWDLSDRCLIEIGLRPESD